MRSCKSRSRTQHRGTPTSVSPLGRRQLSCLPCGASLLPNVQVHAQAGPTWATVGQRPTQRLMISGEFGLVQPAASHGVLILRIRARDDLYELAKQAHDAAHGVRRAAHRWRHGPGRRRHGDYADDFADRRFTALYPPCFLSTGWQRDRIDGSGLRSREKRKNLASEDGRD